MSKAKNPPRPPRCSQALGKRCTSYDWRGYRSYTNLYHAKYVTHRPCRRDTYPPPFALPSRPLIPTPSIFHAPLPIDPRQENALNRSHEPQRNRHSSPQPVQLPAQAKRRAHTDRHRHDVIAKQLDVAAHLLPAEAAQDAVAAGGDGVEELERGADGEDLGDEVDDVAVAGEELGDVVSEAGEEDDVEDADGDGGEAGDAGADFCGVGEGRADEVCDSRGGGDGDGEGDSGG